MEPLDRLGCMTFKTVLLISESNVAGQPHQGRKGGFIVRNVEGYLPADKGKNATAYIKAVFRYEASR